MDSNDAIPLGSNAGSPSYALGLWVYINSWTMNAGNSRKIIYDISNSIELYLEPSSPTLNVKIFTKTGEPTVIPITNNFLIQKWTYVTISVDNSFIDCYIDGKLIKSAKLTALQSPPTTMNPTINLGKGNDITIAGFYRWTNSLVPSDVWNKYMKGNGQNGITSMCNNYGLDVSLIKNQVVSSTYSTF